MSSKAASLGFPSSTGTKEGGDVVTEQTPPVHRWADEHLGMLPHRDLCSYCSQSSQAVCSQEGRGGLAPAPPAPAQPWARSRDQAPGRDLSPGPGCCHELC